MSDLERDNERRLERHKPASTVEVYDTNRDIYVGRLVNIHEQGLMLMGEVEVESDHVYQFDLQLTSPTGGDSVIHVGVDCLWVRGSDQSPTFWSGFHIIDLSDKAREQIHALVGLLAS